MTPAVLKYSFRNITNESIIRTWVSPKHCFLFLFYFFNFIESELAEECQGSATAQGRMELLAGPHLPRSGRRRFHANSCNSSQLPVNARGSGRGRRSGQGEAPEAHTLLASPSSLLFASQQSTADLSQQLEGGGWDRAPRGRGPHPKEEGT